MTLKQAYGLLEVAENSAIETVKQSYRRAAKLYHPDAASGLADTEKFHKIVTAYNLITKDIKRKQILFKSTRKGAGKAPAGAEAAQAGGWRRFAGKTGSKFMDFMGGMRSKSQPKPSHENKARTGSEWKSTSTLTYDELIIRFDKSPNVWLQIEAAHEIYSRFRGRFESFAIPRLPRAQARALVELIQVLGKIKTQTALGAIAPYLSSGDKEVCCSAFMSLENGGAIGQEILDKSIRTPSPMMYYITGLFNRSPFEKHVLKSRLVPSQKMRRLTAVTRRTGLPLQDLLEGVGVSLQSLA
ncbi:MAG: DnaJ domain-containing protein [Nitrospinae bacterium]|nr:DnaJ domain-containing protein [Nitrospinota bacterium]